MSRYSYSDWTIEKILALSKQDVLDLWSTSPAVAFEKLNGDYIGLLPNAGDARAQADALANMFNEDGFLGYWYGKSFKGPSEGQAESEGYNRWRQRGELIHTLRFSTKPGTSLLDGNPAYMMYYNAYQPSMTLTDEVRQVDDHFFVGCGHEGSECGHFVVIGPVAEWAEF